MSVCEQCGTRVPPTGWNDHIRACPLQDPVQIAHLIVERGDYLDAHAEIVAAAYLKAVEA